MELMISKTFVMLVKLADQGPLSLAFVVCILTLLIMPFIRSERRLCELP